MIRGKLLYFYNGLYISCYGNFNGWRQWPRGDVKKQNGARFAKNIDETLLMVGFYH